MKIIFKVSIFTYIYAVLMIFMGYINVLILTAVVLLIHELGHILFIKFFGYKIKRISLYPCGAIIDTDITINVPSSKLFFISIAGVMMQILLEIVTFNWNGYNIELLHRINHFVILFNLFPIYPLDGYKIILSILENLGKYKLVVKITYGISFTALLILFFLSKNILMFVLLYVFNINYILIHPYYYHKFLLERFLYPYRWKHSKKTKCLKDMYKTRNNYIRCGNIYIEEEEMLKRVFSNVY